MTATHILQELEAMGSESTKRTFKKHGAPEPLFGVKVGDLKKIVQRVKKNHDLSLALYDTGNSDAMYLAGLIADEKKISRHELQHWVERASWHMLSESTVAWVAAESSHGWALGLEWIESDQEHIAAAGWATLASWVMIRPDDELNLPELEALLKRVAATLPEAPNRVRYTMNGFIMACGIYVSALAEQAIAVASRVGKFRVDMGGTACKVPDAVEYIKKTAEKGQVSKKKKMARC